GFVSCGMGAPPAATVGVTSITEVSDVPPSAAVASVTASAATPTAVRPAPAGSAVWMPPLDDIVSLRGALISHAELRGGTPKGQCRTLTRVSPPCHVFDDSIAPHRNFLLLWYRCGQQEHTLEVYDTGTGQRTARANLGGGAELSPTMSAELRWTGGENILL